MTDSEWYRFLLGRPDLREVNFWRPSARRAFRAPEFSPFLFKLRSPHNAICGFAYFAKYSKLPVWLAWEVFEEGNGVRNLQVMEARLAEIRRRIRFKEDAAAAYIGCTVLVDAVFFPESAWITQPSNWPVRTQTDMKFDLDVGEGRRVWQECLAIATDLGDSVVTERGLAEEGAKYGEPFLVRPRLGQKSFRIVVTDAYDRACAATGEHSLPALDAVHVMPFQRGGPHEVRNGLLLRADLHRLFDKGYLTVTPDLRIEVSERLKREFHNGRTYYPLRGAVVREPAAARYRIDTELLRWHNENVFVA